VTGTIALAAHTGAAAFHWAAIALYLGLVAAWLLVSVRTVRGTWRGALLRPAGPAINHADEVAALTLAAE
jgi:hypothetical protein